jgi:hypothetical protein
MEFVLEVPKRFSENNFIGRLTYGDIGLDLARRGKPEADLYLKACISLFDEINASEKSQLLSSFDFASRARIEEFEIELKKLETLMKSIYKSKSKSKIPEAKILIENLLRQL